MFNKPGELESYNFDCDFNKIKCAKPKILPDKLKLYIDYQWERTKIYYKKEILKQSYPWTNNIILKQYRFTNTRRELDRESKWLIDNILNQKDISYENKILNIFLFRIINLGQTFENLFNSKYFNFLINEKEFLKKIKKLEKKIENMEKDNIIKQSSAYLLTGVSNAIIKYVNEYYKIDINNFLKRIIYLWLIKDNILEIVKNSNPFEFKQKFLKYPGIKGNFISYQIWLDLTYIGAYTPNSNNFYPYSENTFVISGIGSDKGILRLVGKKENLDGLSFTEFIYWFKNNIEKLCEENNLYWNSEKMFSFLPKNQRQWSLACIENSFCEFEKFNKYIFDKNIRYRLYNINNKNKLKF